MPEATADPAGAEAALPFAGLRVLDAASYIAAPAAATMLADLGADVIKIEPPEGDPYRVLYKLPGYPATERNAPWELTSRHKRSLCIDLKTPEGQAVLHRLVRQADVFITNLPLPVRGRLALDAPTLLALHPQLIYASLTAYGEVGPEAAKTGFDITAYWARSGLMDGLRSDADAPPPKPGAGLGDQPTAVTLYAAIVTGLYRRLQTGRGGLVGTSLMANGLWSNAVPLSTHLAGGRHAAKPPRSQARNPLTNLYRCADGRWLQLLILNEQRQLPALLTALGLDDWADNPLLTDPATREAGCERVVALFDAAFACHALAVWRQRLDAAGITFGLIGTLDDLPHDAQARAAGLLRPRAGVAADDARAADLAVASPVHLAGVTPRAPGPAPALGQHNQAVLQQAGFGDDELAALVARGVLRGA